MSLHGRRMSDEVSFERSSAQPFYARLRCRACVNEKNPPRNWRGLIPGRRPRWLSGEIFVRSGSWFRAQFGWIAVDVR